VRLHEVAVACLPELDETTPWLGSWEEYDDGGAEPVPYSPTRYELAPQASRALDALTDTHDYLRRKWTHIAWLAMARITGRRGRF
jgi:hypothetical protein